MCLSIPGKVKEIYGEDLNKKGKVEFGGAIKEVSLAYVPEVRVDDYVIVHAGFAISIVDEDEARETLEYFKQIGEMEQ